MVTVLLDNAKAMPSNTVIPEESYWLPAGKIPPE